MARHESDREDLLREATALVERAELRLPSLAEPVVVGFRRSGEASFYFGSDPVFQFNSWGQLRRAFVAGKLLKAQAGRLIELRRERMGAEVALLRHELTANEQAGLVSEARSRLAGLALALDTSDFEVTGSMPPDADVVGRIRQWLGNFAGKVAVAARPNVQ